MKITNTQLKGGKKLTKAKKKFRNLINIKFHIKNPFARKANGRKLLKGEVKHEDKKRALFKACCGNGIGCHICLIVIHACRHRGR